MIDDVALSVTRERISQPGMSNCIAVPAGLKRPMYCMLKGKGKGKGRKGGKGNESPAICRYGRL